MAYSLQISLMGQKSYSGLVVEQASINEYAPSPKRENLRESLKLYKKTIVLVTAILIVFSFLWSLNK